MYKRQEEYLKLDYLKNYNLKNLSVGSVLPTMLPNKVFLQSKKLKINRFRTNKLLLIIFETVIIIALYALSICIDLVQVSIQFKPKYSFQSLFSFTC
jgi:hypothetical protein